MRKEFAGAAPRTTLTANLPLEHTGTFDVTNATGYPTGSTAPFVIVINRGSSLEEKVLIQSRTNNTLTIEQRGYDGTLPQQHDQGASVHHILDAETISELNEFSNPSVGLLSERPVANGSRGLYRSTDAGTFIDFEGEWFQVVTEEGGRLAIGADNGIKAAGREGLSLDFVENTPGNGATSIRAVDANINVWEAHPSTSLPQVSMNVGTGSENTIHLEPGMLNLRDVNVSGGRFGAAFSAFTAVPYDTSGTHTIDLTNTSSYLIAGIGTSQSHVFQVTWPTMQTNEMFSAQIMVWDNNGTSTITWPSDWIWASGTVSEADTGPVEPAPGTGDDVLVRIFLQRIYLGSQWRVYASYIPSRVTV